VKNSVQQEIIAQAEDLPWLVFKLKTNYYTINSRIVTTILLLPENITPVATSIDMFRGIINYRGEILPLLDMRKFFGLPTIAQELKELQELIAEVKQSHVAWHKEFNRCLSENAPFSLSLDPRRCKLGKWIVANENTNVHAIKVQVARLSDSHNKVYETGAEILHIKKDRKISAEAKETEINKKLVCLENLVFATCGFIDGLEAAFVQSNVEMGIVLANGTTTLCIIVDEVVAVDELDIITDNESFPNFQEKEYVVGIAHSAKTPGEIMMVSEETLINVIKRYEDSLKH